MVQQWMFRSKEKGRKCMLKHICHLHCMAKPVDVGNYCYSSVQDPHSKLVQTDRLLRKTDTMFLTTATKTFDLRQKHRTLSKCSPCLKLRTIFFFFFLIKAHVKSLGKIQLPFVLTTPKHNHCPKQMGHSQLVQFLFVFPHVCTSTPLHFLFRK